MASLAANDPSMGSRFTGILLTPQIMYGGQANGPATDYGYKEGGGSSGPGAHATNLVEVDLDMDKVLTNFTDPVFLGAMTQRINQSSPNFITTLATTWSNTTGGNSSELGDSPKELNWGILSLSLLIFATAVGNTLVCLAVCWERRLQNMTNYFLMSLAIADLLVALLVMPLGLIVELYGWFPLDPSFCVVWASMDVLMCTASIWHMCTMSMDRYFTLKYPMKYGRNKTKTMVALKITFVWVISMAICSPLCIMGLVDHTNVFNGGICMPTIKDFVIYGSTLAFYVPLLIMVVTYTLTIQILCNNQKIMTSIVREQSNAVKLRKERSGGNGTTNGVFLTPTFIPRFMDRGSLDTSVSYNASVNESTLPSTDESLDEPSRHENNRGSSVCEATTTTTAAPAVTTATAAPAIPIVTEPPTDIEGCNEDYQLMNSIENFEYGSGRDSTLVFYGMRSNLSVSQPHLPSLERNRLSTSNSHNSFHKLTRTRSHLSVADIESVKNFDSVISLNSMLSRQNFGSGAWSNFDDPDMLDKLSQIEAEMDECLLDSDDSKDAHRFTLSSSITTKPDSNSIIPEEEDHGEVVEGDDDVFEESASLGHSSGKKADDSPILSKASSSTARLMHQIPPVTVTTTSPISTRRSYRSTDGSSTSEQSGYMTIQLRPSGCFLYKVDNCKSSLSPGVEPCVSSSTFTFSSASACQSPAPQRKSDSLSQNTEDSPPEQSTDDALSDAYSQSTVSMQQNRKFSPNIALKKNRTPDGYASGWKTFLRHKKHQKYKVNGLIIKQVIPKRTASNERKASKVLGIIFAVFVILWTPFFILNIVSVACEKCMSAVTPSIMAAIVWLGYCSSLANPIIYTMFNTSFRRAFYKILTCQYPVRKQHHMPRAAGETMHLTHASAWGSDQRRNTLNN